VGTIAIEELLTAAKGCPLYKEWSDGEMQRDKTPL
jgi:hypothetical protein